MVCERSNISLPLSLVRQSGNQVDHLWLNGIKLLLIELWERVDSSSESLHVGTSWSLHSTTDITIDPLSSI